MVYMNVITYTQSAMGHAIIVSVDTLTGGVSLTASVKIVSALLSNLITSATLECPLVTILLNSPCQP